jgi:hypothetical protein
LTINKFASQLSNRQLLYLNYAIRLKLPNQFMNWNNLHLNIESPSRANLTILPTLNKSSDIPELRAQPKK